MPLSPAAARRVLRHTHAADGRPYVSSARTSSLASSRGFSRAARAVGIWQLSGDNEGMVEAADVRTAESQPLDHLWTPAARAVARLSLVADEEFGSMQHFTTVLLVGDLL